MRNRICFLGIDMGTTGIRAIVADHKGRIIGSATEGIEKSFVDTGSSVRSEQDPAKWKEPLFNVLGKVLSGLQNCELRSICVDSTSGTILPIDRNCRPIHNALLHNDIRAQKESRIINSNTDITVKPSFALPKILWIKNNEPELFKNSYKFIHAADYIAGLISGNFTTTDFSNAVKTGYDLVDLKWPESIESVLGIPLEKLPGVVKTGEIVGELSKGIKEEFGIRHSVKIVAGATDSTTGFYSSGASRIGDWNTTLGTVLGIRGISGTFIRDPEGLLYAHRHPEGYWLPGGASNTGGESLRVFFGDKVKEYDRRIEGLPPTESIIYPLVRKSEKLPFINMDAEGFVIMDKCEPAYMFKGFLEGISYIERLIYEKIENLGYRINDTIYSMGGGAYSYPWLKIRANILERNIAKASIVETAFGACIIAAAPTHYGSLTESIKSMVKLEVVVEPVEKEKSIYHELFRKFIDECRKRGYLE